MNAKRLLFLLVMLVLVLAACGPSPTVVATQEIATATIQERVLAAKAIAQCLLDGVIVYYDDDTRTGYFLEELSQSENQLVEKYRLDRIKFIGSEGIDEKDFGLEIRRLDDEIYVNGVSCTPSR